MVEFDDSFLDLGKIIREDQMGVIFWEWFRFIVFVSFFYFISGFIFSVVIKKKVCFYNVFNLLLTEKKEKKFSNIIMYFKGKVSEFFDSDFRKF